MIVSTKMIYSPKQLRLDYHASFTLSEKGGLDIWFAIPQSFKTQRIQTCVFSHKPTLNYRDKKGNEIHYFSLRNKEEFKLRMTLTATLSKQKHNISELKLITPCQINSRILQQYTKSEDFLEQLPAIRKLTKTITSKERVYGEKIKKIFDYVSTDFRYSYPVHNRGVSNLNLSQLRGDCAEYSGLFVTLCRTIGIPSRNCTGFLISEEKNSPSEHGWASVYLKKLGWVDLDTQFASIDKTNNYFLETPDYRITFVRGFNIPLKPNIHNPYYVSYWLKQGLPLTKSSAQVLQPLIFSSDRKVVFKDICKTILT